MRVLICSAAAAVIVCVWAGLSGAFIPDQPWSWQQAPAAASNARALESGSGRLLENSDKRLLET
jgi:hypothetical protein